MRLRSNTSKIGLGERTILLGGVHEGDGWASKPKVLHEHEVPLVELLSCLRQVRASMAGRLKTQLWVLRGEGLPRRREPQMLVGHAILPWQN